MCQYKEGNRCSTVKWQSKRPKRVSLSGMENSWDIKPSLMHLLCPYECALKKSPMGIKGGKPVIPEPRSSAVGSLPKRQNMAGFHSQGRTEHTGVLELQEVRQQLISGSQGRWWQQGKGIGGHPQGPQAGKRGFRCSRSWWGSGKRLIIEVIAIFPTTYHALLLDFIITFSCDGFPRNTILPWKGLLLFFT